MIRTTRAAIPTILTVGALWGIFEATAGYALHLLPWNIGSYIWFPAAYFFMDRIYRATGKRWAVAAVAFLSAAIKLLNLLSPMRPDYVINPAVSIVLESLAMLGVLSAAALRDRRSIGTAMAKILAVNTLWRLMYALYLALLVPDWMREVSVIRDAQAFLPFILRQNLISTIVCAGLQGMWGLLEGKLPRVRAGGLRQGARYAVAGALLVCSALLQFAL